MFNGEWRTGLGLLQCFSDELSPCGWEGGEVYIFIVDQDALQDPAQGAQFGRRVGIAGHFCRGFVILLGFGLALTVGLDGSRDELLGGHAFSLLLLFQPAGEGRVIGHFTPDGIKLLTAQFLAQPGYPACDSSGIWNRSHFFQGGQGF